MDEKRKLIIFDRSEVFLLFIFIVLIAVTMFTLGLRIGKNISYKQEGFTDEDREKIETLKSTQEESVEEMLVKKGEQSTSEEKGDSNYNKVLQEELGRLSKEGPTSEVKVESALPKEASEKAVAPEAMPAAKEESSKPSHSTQSTKTLLGKYTIQLGSHATMKEAEDFADGFAVRGYNPIISEVKIPGKGTWYRVGLGSFESSGEAKDYIKKEESLFQGQDYIITEIK